ncbi:MAG: hypothetical protein EA361_19325 [Bacteroidetes bacterium]|nr:MAG: hypothetical protein EA361_19325 [Bacteroidota bacterium]
MKALFIGDSITEGFDLEKFFPGKGYVNHGISGYSSEELLDAMHKGWFASAPEMVFLCIGTNDLARDYDEADTLDTIRRLLVKIREHAPDNSMIYLTSLFPARHNPPRPNPVIRQLNSRLHELAVQENAAYLHLHPFFTDENGQLKREFTDDGLHLNEHSYAVWAELVKQLINF